MTVSAETLFDLIQSIFLTKGMSQEHAKIAADVLLFADLRGIDSHGVARLPGYIRLINERRINVNPQFHFERRNKTMVRMNADAAIGLVSAHMAMKEAIKITHDYGSGWVTIHNSNHFGVSAYHAMLAFEHDYIGMVMTNASPLVVPAFGTQRMLGTNPLCIAIPGTKDHFVLDMATSAVSNGKLEIAQRNGERIPPGWAIDASGNQSNDPGILSKNGALLPLGSDQEHGLHKGYGLASWIDIFSGVLSGANFGPWVPPFVSFLAPQSTGVGQGIGHFVGCWDMQGFNDLETSKDRLQLWINTFRNSQSEKGKTVMIPGEPEQLTFQKRVKEGIPLNNIVYQNLKDICDELKLSITL